MSRRAILFRRVNLSLAIFPPLIRCFCRSISAVATVYARAVRVKLIPLHSREEFPFCFRYHRDLSGGREGGKETLDGRR